MVDRSVAVGLQTAAQLINAFRARSCSPGSRCISRQECLRLDVLFREPRSLRSACSSGDGGEPRIVDPPTSSHFSSHSLRVDDRHESPRPAGRRIRSDAPRAARSARRLVDPLLYLPLLAVTFGLLWSHGTRSAPAPARQVRAALALLAAAVAMRVLVGILEIRGYPRVDGNGRSALRPRGAELGAWILVAAAFVAECGDRWRRWSRLEAARSVPRGEAGPPVSQRDCPLT